MSATRRAPDSKLVAIALMGGLGRMTLALALALGSTHALWGYPADVRRIYLALLAAALLLGCAAYLIQDPRWLLQTAIWSGAVACVILLGAMAKGFFAHAPNPLKGRELYPAIAALTFFVFAVVYLRRQRR